MIGNILAKRYARALLESLREEEVEPVRRDIETFEAILRDSMEMRKLLLSPIFSPEEKKGIIKTLSERIGLSKASQGFLGLLIEKDRLGYFKEIRTSFEGLLYERRNKVKAYVTSSNSFSPSHEALLRERLRELTKKEVDMDIKTDPSLIGGLVVRIGDVIYDGSIKGQLNSMKEELLERV